MAQTKRKRRSKHRGTAAGMVESRGRTGRPPKPEERKAATRAQAKQERLMRAPTWKAAAIRAAITSVFLPVVLIFALKFPVAQSLVMTVFAFLLYVPLGYYTDLFVYRRRMRRTAPRAR